MKKTIKKILCAILIITILYSMFPTMSLNVYASDELKDMELETFKWIQNTLQPEHCLGLLYEDASQEEIKTLENLSLEITKNHSNNYDKIKSVCDWMRENIKYKILSDMPEFKTHGMDVRTAYETYRLKMGKCTEYTNLSVVLLRMSGIPSIGICDNISNPCHAYSAAFDGEKWIFFDSTWADGDGFCFDIPPEQLSNMAYHRLSKIDGICLDNGVYSVYLHDKYNPYNREKSSLLIYPDEDSTDITVHSKVYGTPADYFHSIFKENKTIKRVEFEDGITLIPTGAFLYCSNLEEVVIPDSVTTIGNDIFGYCTSMKEVVIPDSVTELGGGIINNSGVEKITIGGGVKTLLNISGAENLKVAILKEGVEELGAGSFRGNLALKELHLPSTLKKIGNYAFYNGDAIVEKIYYNGTRDDWKKIYKGTLNSGISLKNVVFLQESEEPDTSAQPEIIPIPAPTPNPAPLEPATPEPQPGSKPAETVIPEPSPAPEPVKPVTPEPKPNPEPAPGQEAPLKNFIKKNTYKNGMFTDVEEGSWYEESVKAAYEYGIMNGKGNGIFAPNDHITLVEVIKMASVIHNIYNGGNGEADFEKHPTWHTPYVLYAFDTYLPNGVRFGGYTSPSSKGNLAYVFASSVPSGEFQPIRTVTGIPNLSRSYDYYSIIMMLFNAGVLSGNSKYGHFNADALVTRAEAAAILSRIIDPSLRSDKEILARQSLDTVGITITDPQYMAENERIKITKIEIMEPEGDITMDVLNSEITVPDGYVDNPYQIKVYYKTSVSLLNYHSQLSSGGQIENSRGRVSNYYGVDNDADNSYVSAIFNDELGKGDFVFRAVISTYEQAFEIRVHFTAK